MLLKLLSELKEEQAQKYFPYVDINRLYFKSMLNNKLIKFVVQYLKV